MPPKLHPVSHTYTVLCDPLGHGFGWPASRKSRKFDSQVGKVGHGRKLIIEVEKMEEKQRSITGPTAFADSKTSG